ncbi:carbohydrate ABC transporter permease [Mobiluncus curtisii]|uniref:carbohydrate ABC transporter permease n=1 Tax=Mobiluncus curtisii TaxID=2051 RepID=UPI0014706C73|nr:carbohydrate ABC transporter permease [Mobiluncus curtisii]MCU9986935.1 carbohydrate ABC transporter permease [Mobiluncus curtisii]MCU9999835.1 carbohydrate ABC transporter permease [Mobiluncus curtisii]NMW44237.1 carbohydrate ABC transporter permease [Mobiluncus curtisii]NMW49184.1 carbohydrate ABC transporter permease [Mobiluncus curtisii]NMW83090.1 carbohydrate ABC transporter permease [Mobiluncus curtisii]
MNCEELKMTTTTLKTATKQTDKHPHMGHTGKIGSKKHHGLGFYCAWGCLIILLIITVFPFLWMLRSSLMTNTELLAHPGTIWPKNPTFDAYRRVFGMTTPEESLAQGGAGASINFWLYLRNSCIVASTVMVGQTLFSAMAAYAFSRLRWRGREVVFAIFLSALMVPAIFTAIPNFVLIKQLGLLNTFAGIVLPTFFMTPFSIFFLRQFFLGIPREIDEAAMIDGAGPFKVFFRVICPMTSAPIITLAVLTFINAWNDYMWPLLVGQSDRVRVLTVALGIFRAQKPQGSPDWTALMAAALVSALPIIILFTILGKRIVNSVGFSGIK